MKILVDIDGVLAATQQAIAKIRGIDFPNPWPVDQYHMGKVYGITDEELWNGCDESWWANIPQTDEAQHLMDLATSYSNNVYLVTKPMHYGGASGKIVWIEKNFQMFANRYFITPCRHAMADDDTFLIDDSSENVDFFNQAGGRAILMPRPWNRDAVKSNQSLDAVVSRLGNCVKAWDLGVNELKGKEWH